MKKESGLGLAFKKDENFGEWYSDVSQLLNRIGGFEESFLRIRSSQSSGSYLGNTRPKFSHPYLSNSAQILGSNPRHRS